MPSLGSWLRHSRRYAHQYNLIQPVDTNHINALLSSATALEHAAVPVLRYSAWFDPEQVTRTMQRVPRMLQYQRRKGRRAAGEGAELAWAFASCEVKDAAALDVVAEAAEARIASQLQPPTCTRPSAAGSRYLYDDRPRVVLRDFTAGSLAQLLAALAAAGHRHEGLMQAAAAHLTASSGRSLRLSSLPAPLLARLAILAAESGVRRRSVYDRLVGYTASDPVSLPFAARLFDLINPHVATLAAAPPPLDKTSAAVAARGTRDTIREITNVILYGSPERAKAADGDLAVEERELKAVLSLVTPFYERIVGGPTAPSAV
eukprot:XP_001695607.1 predicted protein [Chlamydomonas reinhardtii]